MKQTIKLMFLITILIITSLSVYGQSEDSDHQTDLFQLYSDSNYEPTNAHKDNSCRNGFNGITRVRNECGSLSFSYDTTKNVSLNVELITNKNGKNTFKSCSIISTDCDRWNKCLAITDCVYPKTDTANNNYLQVDVDNCSNTIETKEIYDFSEDIIGNNFDILKFVNYDKYHCYFLGHTNCETKIGYYEVKNESQPTQVVSLIEDHNHNITDKNFIFNIPSRHDCDNISKCYKLFDDGLVYYTNDEYEGYSDITVFWYNQNKLIGLYIVNWNNLENNNKTLTNFIESYLKKYPSDLKLENKKNEYIIEEDFGILKLKESYFQENCIFYMDGDCKTYIGEYDIENKTLLESFKIYIQTGVDNLTNKEFFMNVKEVFEDEGMETFQDNEKGNYIITSISNNGHYMNLAFSWKSNNNTVLAYISNINKKKLDNDIFEQIIGKYIEKYPSTLTDVCYKSEFDINDVYNKNGFISINFNFYKSNEFGILLEDRYENPNKQVDCRSTSISCKPYINEQRSDMNTGSQAGIDGKIITLVKVGTTGVVVNVSGVVSFIYQDETEKINGIKIMLESFTYAKDPKDRRALLKFIYPTEKQSCELITDCKYPEYNPKSTQHITLYDEICPHQYDKIEFQSAKVDKMLYGYTDLKKGWSLLALGKGMNYEFGPDFEDNLEAAYFYDPITVEFYDLFENEDMLEEIMRKAGYTSVWLYLKNDITDIRTSLNVDIAEDFLSSHEIKFEKGWNFYSTIPFIYQGGDYDYFNIFGDDKTIKGNKVYLWNQQNQRWREDTVDYIKNNKFIYGVPFILEYNHEYVAKFEDTTTVPDFPEVSCEKQYETCVINLGCTDSECLLRNSVSCENKYNDCLN